MISSLIILFAGAVLAGFLGSLTGLGGGVIIVPLMTIGLGIDIHYAIGTSLVTVIATSSGAASAFVKEGLLNIRIGMFLEIATTTGAIIGASVAVFAPTHAIAVIFGLVLIYSAAVSFFKHHEIYSSVNLSETNSPKIIQSLKLDGVYQSSSGAVKYKVNRAGTGFAFMTLAGMLSGLLGIGSGALKVIAMDSVMRIPFKVSTSTSNFMIGVTAAASAGIYLSRGYIDPVLSMPVMLGVLIGSLSGAGILLKARTKYIRIIFAVVIAFLAFEMIYNGLTGKI